MDAESLRALQAPLKARYRDEPAAARLTMRAEGMIDPGAQACRVETPAGAAAAGLHPLAGGDGSWACSGEMLLQALAACAGVTLGAVATAMNIPVRGGRVIAEGDLDFRGTLGVARDAPIGFTAVRLRFELETDAPDDALGNLLRLTERYCVVYQSLTAPAPIESTLTRLGPGTT